MIIYNFSSKKLINFFLDFEFTLSLYLKIDRKSKLIVSLFKVKKLLMPAVFLLIKITKYFTT